MTERQFPEDFKNQYTHIRGEVDFKAFAQSFHNDTPVSIRINPLKWNTLPGESMVPWATNAVYLEKRPVFACDPLWHAGTYYVQDSSSMFLEHVFGQLAIETENPVVLDLCGAPGGKSTHLASILKDKGLLVANEVIRSRAVILTENLRKWGTPDVVVTNNDPADFGKHEGLFDVIVADAPCSGEGLFRKNPQAMTEWSSHNVNLCAERQKRIIADVWPSLKPGGFLIYSTCTFNMQENEENLRWINETYEAEPITIQANEEWDLVPSELEQVPGWHFYPHRVNGEGFFIAVLKKRDGREFRLSRKRDLRTMEVVPKKVLLSTDIFKREFSLVQIKGVVSAISPQWEKLIDHFRTNFKVLHQGITTGMISKKGFVAEHDLYTSCFLLPEYLERYHLSDDEALQFIAKEHFLPQQLIKGQRYLAVYKNQVLGGFKYLGNRVNTSFPVEWRLRKSCDSVSTVL